MTKEELYIEMQKQRDLRDSKINKFIETHDMRLGKNKSELVVIRSEEYKRSFYLQTKLQERYVDELYANWVVAEKASIKFNVDGLNVYIPTCGDGSYKVTYVDDIGVIPTTYRQKVFFENVNSLKLAPVDCGEAIIDFGGGRIVTIFQHEVTMNIIVYSFKI